MKGLKPLYKLTAEEQVFAEQLFQIRKNIDVLKMEEVTQADKLSAIMRGHRIITADGNWLWVSYNIQGGMENIVVTKKD